MTVGNSSEEEIEIGRGGSKSLPVRISVNSFFTGEEDMMFEEMVVGNCSWVLMVVFFVGSSRCLRFLL